MFYAQNRRGDICFSRDVCSDAVMNAHNSFDAVLLQSFFAPTCMINNLKLFSGLFVVVSWISFVVPPDVIPGRMALLITLFLVLGKFPHCEHLEIYLQYGSMAVWPRGRTKQNQTNKTEQQSSKIEH
jgi:hypothetical protein